MSASVVNKIIIEKKNVKGQDLKDCLVNCAITKKMYDFIKPHLELYYNPLITCEKIEVIHDWSVEKVKINGNNDKRPFYQDWSIDHKED